MSTRSWGGAIKPVSILQTMPQGLPFDHFPISPEGGLCGIRGAPLFVAQARGVGLLPVQQADTTYRAIVADPGWNEANLNLAAHHLFILMVTWPVQTDTKMTAVTVCYTLLEFKMGVRTNDMRDADASG